MAKIQKKSKQQFHLIPFFLFSTQRLSIREPPNYLPTEATEPTEVSDARYSPTDFADMHRLGGYGIPAIPTQPLNYLPTEFTHKIFWRRRKICVHLCASVGGPSTPETSVGSACSVGEPCASKPSVRIRGRLFSARSFCVFCEFRGRTLRSLTICVHLCASVGGYSPPEASVNSVNSVGGLAQTNLEWVLWKEFGGRRGYGRDAIPSYENSHRLHGCAQIRRQKRNLKNCGHPQSVGGL